MKKNKGPITFEEFEKIFIQLKTAFEFEDEMLNISRKYVEKQVLFDYISTSSTYLASSVWTLLNKIFLLGDEDDLFSWWCLECEFGEKFNIGDLEETTISKRNKFRKPDLTNTQGLYDYCVFCYNRKLKEKSDK